MTAEMLEEFLVAPPEYQNVMIEQQRRLDRCEREMIQLREREEYQRQVILEKHLPPWRRWFVGLTWRLYCHAMPKYLRG